MPLRNTFPDQGTKTPGLAYLRGAFVVNGASAPLDANVFGDGFTVSAPSTGVYTVTLTDGLQKYGFAQAWLSEIGANSTKRAYVGTKATLLTAGTFTIHTQSTAGTDANLSAGEVVEFEVAIINMG